MHVSQLSEKVRAERSKNPPVMIEGKTTDQALQKICCILNKNVSLAVLLDRQSALSFQLNEVVNISSILPMNAEQ